MLWTIKVQLIDFSMTKTINYCTPAMKTDSLNIIASKFDVKKIVNSNKETFKNYQYERK